MLDEVETLLLAWINKRQMAAYSLFESTVCENTRSINADLTKDNPSVRDSVKCFVPIRDDFTILK